jgi:hypothetical protein
MPYHDLSPEEDALIATVRGMVASAASAKVITAEEREAIWVEGERAGSANALLWVQARIQEELERAQEEKYADTRKLLVLQDLVQDQIKNGSPS